MNDRSLAAGFDDWLAGVDGWNGGWSVAGVDGWLVAGVGAAVVLLLALLLFRRGTAAGTRSRRAHEAARERRPPVEIGETYEFGITEITDHHSGTRVAVGKVEGFVLFASDVPDGVDEGDVVRATVLSFNRGRTSADATVVGTG